MGLWLVQECRRPLGAGRSYDELHRARGRGRAGRRRRCSTPTTTAACAPGDMPARIAEACRALGQPAPADRGEIVRSILVSLACKYRLVLERLERVTGREVDVVHVIGGGSRNALLCQLTADLLGRPVLAGPVEATALGNVLVQARAVGELGSLAEMRAVPPPRRPTRPCSSRAADGDASIYRALPGEGDAAETRQRRPCRDRTSSATALEIETPSWGYGDSGTRFATFQQPGRPRDVFERIDDAAEVHRLTGTAPAVALHFPWDAVDDLAALRRHDRGARPADRRRQPEPVPGPRLQARLDHASRRGGAPEGDRPSARVRRDRARARVDRAVAVVRRRHELPGPGRPRRSPSASDRVPWQRSTRRSRPSRSCCSSTSRSSPRSTRRTCRTGARRCSRA